MSVGTTDSSDSLLDINDEILKEQEIQTSRDALAMYKEMNKEMLDEIENWDDSVDHYDEDGDLYPFEKLISVQKFTQDDVDRVQGEINALLN